jgi:hypothetical protein
MRRFSLSIGLVAAMASVSCGGAVAPQQYTPLERHTLLVLYERGASCHARLPKNFRAYEGDTVVWEIVNECSTAKLVQIVFPGQNPVTFLNGVSSINVNPNTQSDQNTHAYKEIKATVNGNTKGHKYPYHAKVDGATGADPDLEIDPYI